MYAYKPCLTEFALCPVAARVRPRDTFAAWVGPLRLSRGEWLVGNKKNAIAKFDTLNKTS